MDWSVLASSRIEQITKPKSAGQVVNPHVVRHTVVPAPDYEKMRDLAHKPSSAPEIDASEAVPS